MTAEQPRRRRPTKQQLEASAERVIHEVADRLAAGMAAFQRQIDRVIGDAMDAAREALAKGEPLDVARAKFSFVRDAAVASAVDLLCGRYVGPEEFENMPIRQLGQDWSGEFEECVRVHLAGKWLLVSTTPGGQQVFWKPMLDDDPTSHLS